MSEKQTEEPISEMVFTQEIKRLDEKIDSSTRRLSNEILNVKEEIQDIKRAMSTKDDISTILNRIDSFTTNIETFDRRSIVRGKRLDDAEVTLSNHENRLSKLESK